MTKRRSKGDLYRNRLAIAGRNDPTDQPSNRPGPSPTTGVAFWRPATPSASSHHMRERRSDPLTGRAASPPRSLAAGTPLDTRIPRGESQTRSAEVRKVPSTTDRHPGHSSKPTPVRSTKLSEGMTGVGEPHEPQQDTRATPGPVAAPGVEDPSAPALPLLARRGVSSGTNVTSLSCAPMDDMQPQSLGVTYWFDTKPTGGPYSVNLHLQGRRPGSDHSKPADFSTVATVDDVLPGSGPVSVTTRITAAQGGSWTVQATPVTLVADDETRLWAVLQDPLTPVRTITGETLFAPLNRALAPGVLIGAWPALVSLGAILGVGLQSVLADRLGLLAGHVALLTVIACLLGLIGAKTYYLLTHPDEKKRILTSGLSVQGFVITVGLTLLVGSWALSIPTGLLFDISAPGLLLGMTVGRLGCLLGGCCAGRPTRSRWGVWSSDRRIGTRRIPVQLLESATALISSVAAASAVLTIGVPGKGLVFLASLSGYTAARQLLFPLRDIPRATSYGRQVVLAISFVVALAASSRLLPI